MFKEETLAQKLITKGFFLYFFSFLIAPSGYIVKLIISNDLEVADVWVIYSIIWLISILSNYNDLGLSESLKYFLPRFWFEKKYSFFKTSIFWAFLVQFLTAILIWFFLFLWADWLAVNYFHSVKAAIVLKIFSFYFVLLNIFSTLENIFFVFQDVFWQKFFEFVRMWSIVIFSLIIFVKWWWSVFSYSLAWFLGMIVSLLIAIIVFFKKYRKIFSKWYLDVKNFNLLKKLFYYSIWVVLAIQWWILLGNIDQQMIIYFLWPQMAWYYTTYWSLLNIYSLLIWPIFWFLFPLTSELIARKQEWKLKILLSIFYKYFPTFGLVFWLFMLFFWPFVSFVLFWKKFIYSGQLLQIGALSVFLSILISINFNILAWLGKIKERVKIIWIAAIVNFIWNLILINFIWVVWAVITTIIGWFLMAILSYLEIKKFWISWKIDYVFWFKNFLFSFVVLIVSMFILKDVLNFQVSRGYMFFVLFVVGLFYFTSLLTFNWKEVLKLYYEVRKIKKG